MQRSLTVAERVPQNGDMLWLSGLYYIAGYDDRIWSYPGGQLFTLNEMQSAVYVVRQDDGPLVVTEGDDDEACDKTEGADLSDACCAAHCFAVET